MEGCFPGALLKIIHRQLHPSSVAVQVLDHRLLIGEVIAPNVQYRSVLRYGVDDGAIARFGHDYVGRSEQFRERDRQGICATTPAQPLRYDPADEKLIPLHSFHSIKGKTIKRNPPEPDQHRDL